MSLSIKAIRNAKSDEQLVKLLSSELNRRLPEKARGNLDEQVRFIRSLSGGLRAMAATHRLDVSMAMDDLGWHFYNFHSRELADETLRGLVDLEATEAAEVFKKAMKLVEPHWETIGQLKTKVGNAFEDWYVSSSLEKSLNPLNKKLWEISSQFPNHGLMSYWVSYARNYPDKVLAS